MLSNQINKGREVYENETWGPPVQFHKGGVYMIHTQTKDVAVKRDYKSTMFKMIFEDKENCWNYIMQ